MTCCAAPDSYPIKIARTLFASAMSALYATDGSKLSAGANRHRRAEARRRRNRDAAVCRPHRAPILGRGSGTSLAGHCCNVAVVIDMSKYMSAPRSSQSCSSGMQPVSSRLTR